MVAGTWQQAAILARFSTAMVSRQNGTNCFSFFLSTVVECLCFGGHTKL